MNADMLQAESKIARQIARRWQADLIAGNSKVMKRDVRKLADLLKRCPAMRLDCLGRHLAAWNLLESSFVIPSHGLSDLIALYGNAAVTERVFAVTAAARKSRAAETIVRAPVATAPKPPAAVPVRPKPARARADLGVQGLPLFA